MRVDLNCPESEEVKRCCVLHLAVLVRRGTVTLSDGL